MLHFFKLWMLMIQKFCQCTLHLCQKLIWSLFFVLCFLNMHIAHLFNQSHWKPTACIALQSKSEMCTLNILKELKFLSNNKDIQYFFFVSGCFLISAPDVCFDAKVQLKQNIINVKKSFLILTMFAGRTDLLLVQL